MLAERESLYTLCLCNNRSEEALAKKHNNADEILHLIVTLDILRRQALAFLILTYPTQPIWSDRAVTDILPANVERIPFEAGVLKINQAG